MVIAARSGAINPNSGTTKVPAIVISRAS
jgi:hypothetical protein